MEINKKDKEVNENYLSIQKSNFKDYSLLSPLLEINQTPKELNFLGNKNLLDKKDAKILCIVGSRKATTYGKEVTDFLVSGLAGYNIIIVSGLALGIDSAAHKAALKYKIPTISFPGSGLDDDVLYPAINIKLKKEIIEANGLLLSEYESDKRSEIYYFPARNRLMASISDLILVVEAEEKSGTQITARLALEYGKEVAIVPGSIFSAYSRGTAHLFKDGAHPVTCADDILYILGIKSKEEEMQDKKNNKNKSKQKQNSLFENNVFPGAAIGGAQNENKLYETLSEKEIIIMKLLSAPLDKDTLIESSGLLAHEALIAITNLESKNYILDNFGEIKRIR